jgi:hypothetical protein
MITNPAELAIAGAHTRDQALQANHLAELDARKYAKDQQKLDTDMAAAQKPVLDSMAQHEKDSNERLAIAHKAIGEQLDQRMTHFQGIQDEMQKMAMEQPKDLFGQAGVNSIMGRIAIFLGGAGMAGLNGPNENLQRINAMADRNIAAQRNRFEMLSKIGQGDQTMYGMLTQKLQNTDAVEATMRNSFLSMAEAQTKASMNTFAGPKAKIAGEKFLMDAANQRRQNDLAVQNTFQQNATQAMGLAQSQEANRLNQLRQMHQDELKEREFGLKIHQQELKEENYKTENSIDGLNGTVKPAEHAKLSHMAGGARGLVDMLGQMDAMLKGHPSVRKMRAFAVANAQAFKLARDYYETGMRLETGEEKQIATTSLNRADAMFYMLQHGTTGSDVTSLRDKIVDTQALVTRGAWTSLKTAAPNIKFDATDKIWGRFDPNTYKPSYQSDTEEAEGTDEGESELSNAPAFGGNDQNKKMGGRSATSGDYLERNVSAQEAARDALIKRYGGR